MTTTDGTMDVAAVVATLPADVLRTIAIFARRAYEHERWPYFGVAGELRTAPPNATPIGLNIMGNEVRYKFPFALPAAGAGAGARFTDYIVYALGKDHEHMTQFYLYEGPSALIATAWYDIIHSGQLYMHISYKNAQRPLIGLLTVLQRYLPKAVIQAADVQLCYNDAVHTVMQRQTVRDYLSASRTARDL